MRWFRLRFGFWLVCLRSLFGLTAVRFGVLNGGCKGCYYKQFLALYCSFCLIRKDSFGGTKRTKKAKAKPDRSARFRLPTPPHVQRRTFLPFGWLRDTLVSVTFRFLAGVLAQFMQAYRCEIWCSKAVVAKTLLLKYFGMVFHQPFNGCFNNSACLHVIPGGGFGQQVFKRIPY